MTVCTGDVWGTSLVRVMRSAIMFCSRLKIMLNLQHDGSVCSPTSLDQGILSAA